MMPLIFLVGLFVIGQQKGLKDGQPEWKADISDRENVASSDAETIDGREALYHPLLSSGSNQARRSTDSVRVDWVRHYASDVYSGYDVATAVTVDQSGDVYVTGYSAKLPFGVDYVTVKYSSSGEHIWTARYDSHEKGDDLASAICVDPWGNVYVTGKSGASETGWDFATVKYNPEGYQVWVARYNRQGSSADTAKALAVDASGNVYVTGVTYTSGAWSDYATIKYDANGVELWAVHYNGPGNSADYAEDCAVDASGNVYVTGYSLGFVPGEDYATVKYDSDGIEQWVARYDGPSNGKDEAIALAVDCQGNVYVTGSSVRVGYRYDYATVKYSTDGIEEWVARYNGPEITSDYATDLVVDCSGNVYVTGYSYREGTVHDYTTVKYNTAGTEQWVVRHHGGGDYDKDKAIALGLDGSGNVYVTGEGWGSGTRSDFVTVKYNSQGIEQWSARYNGSGNSYDWVKAIAVDASGTVCVIGGSRGSGTGYDYATVKYSTGGLEQWVARYTGSGSVSGWSKAMAIDASGNIYVTGVTPGSGTGNDYTTIKYSPEGTERWVARFSGPGNKNDEPVALTVDALGNVYVTGWSEVNRGPDYATVKYDAHGTELWAVRYDGPFGSTDRASAVAVDSSGNVYVTGESYASGTGDDYATVKYNPDGMEEWVARYNGPGNDYDWATAVAADASGNVYVSGWSEGLDTGGDYATVMYDSDGVEQWVARYNGPENASDYVSALAVDAAGNVYVTGESPGRVGGDDYVTVKYNSDGIEQWVARYDGTGNGDDGAKALAVDAAGNVYVTGKSDGLGIGAGNDYEYATVTYDSNGIERWVARYNGPENGIDWAKAIAIDASGNIYVTGESEGSGTGYDYATVKYNTSGIQEWTVRFTGPANSSNRAVAITVDNSGNVYVTGCTGGYMWSTYSTIKYVQGSALFGHKGDVNGDGQFNVLDVVAAIRHIVGVRILEENDCWRADCNGDGQVDARDVLGIVNVILDTGTCEP